MKFLKGYKTKIGVLALFLLGGLRATGLVDESMYSTLLPIILGWTSYGVYDKIERKD